MKNIEDYGFDRSDLIIATAVNSYLKNLTPDARSEALAGIVRYDGAKTKINSKRLAALIESAKAMAMIGSEGWKDGGDSLMKKSLAFIWEQLPTVDGEKYMENPSEPFLRFIEDCATEK
jgi:hypothetical protein